MQHWPCLQQVTHTFSFRRSLLDPRQHFWYASVHCAHVMAFWRLHAATFAAIDGVLASFAMHRLSSMRSSASWLPLVRSIHSIHMQQQCTAPVQPDVPLPTNPSQAPADYLVGKYADTSPASFCGPPQQTAHPNRCFFVDSTLWTEPSLPPTAVVPTLPQTSDGKAGFKEIDLDEEHELAKHPVLQALRAGVSLDAEAYTRGSYHTNPVVPGADVHAAPAYPPAAFAEPATPESVCGHLDHLHVPCELSGLLAIALPAGAQSWDKSRPSHTTRERARGWLAELESGATPSVHLPALGPSRLAASDASMGTDGAPPASSALQARAAHPRQPTNATVRLCWSPRAHCNLCTGPADAPIELVCCPAAGALIPPRLLLTWTHYDGVYHHHACAPQQHVVRLAAGPGHCAAAAARQGAGCGKALRGHLHG